MNCSKIRKKLLDYQEGDLSPQEKNLVKRHLGDCQDCQKEYFLLKSSWNLMDEGEEPTPSKDFHQRLMARLAETKTPSSGGHFFWYLLSVAASLLLLLGLWFFSGVARELPPSPKKMVKKNLLKGLGISSQEEREIVQNLDLLESYPALQKRELLENWRALDDAIPEEYLSDEN